MPNTLEVRLSTKALDFIQIKKAQEQLSYPFFFKRLTLRFKMGFTPKCRILSGTSSDIRMFVHPGLSLLIVACDNIYCIVISFYYCIQVTNGTTSNATNRIGLPYREGETISILMVSGLS